MIHLVYEVFPRGPGKIQLLSQQAIFGKSGFWHAGDEHEFTAALTANKNIVRTLCEDKRISEVVRSHLNKLLEKAMQGKRIEHEEAKTAIHYLNSMAFRAAGSSTVKRTVWTRQKEEGLAVVGKQAKEIPQELVDYALADVYIKIGDDLFGPIREASIKATQAVAQAVNEAQRKAGEKEFDLRKLRNLAREASLKGFKPKGLKSMTKVDFKLAENDAGEVRAALIDINAGVVAPHIYDKQLEQASLEPGIVEKFADSIIFIHQQETKLVPKRIVITARDSNLLKAYEPEINALRNAIEKNIRRVHGNEAVVGIALGRSVVQGINNTLQTGRPFGVRLAEKGRIESPELIVRYGRFASLGEDEKLKRLGVTVVDKARYTLMSDKTVNGHVFDLIKYRVEKIDKIIVPRRLTESGSIFTKDYFDEIDRIAAHARIQDWRGVVVKLPIKISIGGQDVINAYFFNPNSPLQVEAVQDAVRNLERKGLKAQLTEEQKQRAVLTFEELFTGGLPQLEGKALEVRTLVFPERRKIVSWKRLFFPKKIR